MGNQCASICSTEANTLKFDLKTEKEPQKPLLNLETKQKMSQTYFSASHND